MIALKQCLEKFDIKPSRLVLSVLAWCEKEVTGTFSNWNGKQFASIYQITDVVEFDNSSVHTSFHRSEFHRST